MKEARFIPYEKLSKKERRLIDQARRKSWGELNPVTRKPESSRAYNRNDERRRWQSEHREGSGCRGGFVVLGAGM